MKTTYLLALLLTGFLCFSFVSENKSEILPKKEVSETKILSQKKNLVTSKKQKLNFKERLALKLIEKKIKKIKSKTQKKQSKITNSKTGDFGFFIAVLLILGGLIGGIIALAVGETLLGILLLVGGLIFIPLIFLILLFSTQAIC